VEASEKFVLGIGKFVIIFSILFISVFSIIQVYSISDIDGDGIPDDQDPCPNLREDQDSEVRGCPSEHKIYHDVDYDGIVNHDDQCPTIPETYNMFEDEDGCPDKSALITRGIPDSDNDGISDLDDNCPNQPETFNGILDEDGCPENYIPIRDYDHDWIPNVIDECPTERENYNRFNDYDGCPDKLLYGFDVNKFPDADNDGIDDRWDRCLGEAENYNGYLDWDGCIDNLIDLIDSDGDGVPDIQDVCPNHQENYNRFHDFDGCPDSGPEFQPRINDLDNDGIPNTLDSCPNEKETWNKFQDKDGCPDIFSDQARQIHDSDLDGIIDEDDLCPFESETYNEFSDEDGCPDLPKMDSLVKPTTKTFGKVKPSVSKIFSESLLDDPIKGNPKAPIILVQFSNFNCQFCSEFSEEILPLLEENYMKTGKIQLVFRDFPIDNLRTNSMNAHIAAECASKEGKFWEYHNLLFEKQNEWNGLSPFQVNEKLNQFAKILQLDVNAFNLCLNSVVAAQEVYMDYLDGTKYGATVTPTFFIGNEKEGYIKLEGEIPYVNFKDSIEAQLKCAIYSC